MSKIAPCAANRCWSLTPLKTERSASSASSPASDGGQAGAAGQARACGQTGACGQAGAASQAGASGQALASAAARHLQVIARRHLVVGIAGGRPHRLAGPLSEYALARSVIRFDLP